jgi:hypothetical protein
LLRRRRKSADGGEVLETDTTVVGTVEGFIKIEVDLPNAC